MADPVGLDRVHFLQPKMSKDEEAPAVSCSTLSLLPGEFSMVSSWASSKVTKSTYDVKTGEFEVAIDEDNGGGFVSVKISTSAVFQRAGIKRVFDDPAHTIRVVKAANEGVATEQPTGEVPVSEAVMDLRQLAKRELDTCERYGSKRVVNIASPFNKSDTTDLCANLSISATTLTISFKCFETDEKWGSTSVKIEEIVDVLSKMLKLDSGDSDLGDAFKTADRSGEGQKFKIEINPCFKRAVLHVLLPNTAASAPFLGNNKCFASVLTLYFDA